jgi:hypothetical protein
MEYLGGNPQIWFMAKIENKLIYSPLSGIRLEGYSEGIASPNNQNVGPHPCFPLNLPATNYEISVTTKSSSGGLVTNPSNGGWISCENSLIVGHEMSIPDSTPADTVLSTQTVFGVTVRKKDNPVDQVSGDVVSLLQATVKSGTVIPPDPEEPVPVVYTSSSSILDTGKNIKPYASVYVGYYRTFIEVRSQWTRPNGTFQVDQLANIPWYNPAGGSLDMANTEIHVDVWDIHNPGTSTPDLPLFHSQITNFFTTPGTMYDSINDPEMGGQPIVTCQLTGLRLDGPNGLTMHNYIEFKLSINKVGSPKGSMYVGAFRLTADIDFAASWG